MRLKAKLPINRSLYIYIYIYIYYIYRCIYYNIISVVNSEPHAGFNIFPQNVIQAEDGDAHFQCQYTSASSIGWLINGTSIYTVLPPNVSLDTLNESITVLTISALLKYNGTEICCIATTIQVINRSRIYRVEHSPKAMLIVQG